MYKIKYSELAQIDIISILQYTEETFGLRQSEIYEETLRSSIEKIAQMPTRGHSHALLPLSFLVYNLDSHMIVYTINESQESIEIVRILHKKADLSEFL